MTFQDIVGVLPVVAEAKSGGPYGWLTPHIAALAADDKNFASRILTLPREEVHLLAFIIALMDNKASDADHMATFARSYHRLTRRALYEAFTDGHEPAVLNLLPKLRGKVWVPAHYRMLDEIFSDPQACKAIRHMSKINRSQIKRLSQLPLGFRTGAILKKIRDKHDLDRINFAIDAVRRIRNGLNDRAILASLVKRDCNISDWMMGHYGASPFPPAPVEEIAVGENIKLVPLENYKMLGNTAREFCNCIRTYLYRVLRGDSYFYRYGAVPNKGNGKTKGEKTGIAIVELRRIPVIGWVVHEAHGPDNDQIKRKYRTAIIHAFSEAGIMAAPQAVNPKAWFDLC